MHRMKLFTLLFTNYETLFYQRSKYSISGHNSLHLKCVNLVNIRWMLQQKTDKWQLLSNQVSHGHKNRPFGVWAQLNKQLQVIFSHDGSSSRSQKGFWGKQGCFWPDDVGRRNGQTSQWGQLTLGQIVSWLTTNDRFRLKRCNLFVLVLVRFNTWSVFSSFIELLGTEWSKLNLIWFLFFL